MPSLLEHIILAYVDAFPYKCVFFNPDCYLTNHHGELHFMCADYKNDEHTIANYEKIVPKEITSVSVKLFENHYNEVKFDDDLRDWIRTSLCSKREKIMKVGTIVTSLSEHTQEVVFKEVNATLSELERHIEYTSSFPDIDPDYLPFRYHPVCKEGDESDFWIAYRNKLMSETKDSKQADILWRYMSVKPVTDEKTWIASVNQQLKSIPK